MLHLSDIRMKPKLLALLLLVGAIPVLTVTTVTLLRSEQVMDATEQRAREALEAQVKAQLVSLRGTKRVAVESYFQGHKDRMRTLAESSMVVEAMGEFRSAFAKYSVQRNLNASDYVLMRKDLATYYENLFSSEYRAQNDGADPMAGARLNQLSDRAIALQHQFIFANPHPLGSKDSLDTPKDGTSYASHHESYHPILRSYLQTFGYYDIFLVDPDTGEIVYSVFRELDYATSLSNGPYADTNFGRAFREANAMNQPGATLHDFEPYYPSYEAPASFIAAPVFDGTKKIGVAIMQLPLDGLNTVMNERSGLGKTGETILVGADFLMRSDSYRAPNTHSVRASFKNPETGSVDTPTTHAAIEKGESGVVRTKDYAGNETLTAYTPVEFLGHTWCLNAKMDVAEALAPVEEMISQSKEAMQETQIWIVSMIAGALLLIGLVAVVVSRMISRPLVSAVDAASLVAAGDLTRPISTDFLGKDELGQLSRAIGEMQAKLRTIVNEIRVGSHSILSESREIASGNTELSERTNAEAAAIEETSASMEKMTTTVRQNTEAASRANGLAGEAASYARNGSEILANAADAMERITRGSREIGEITGTIDELAFQTNLLALNAAIEAERAGEHGRGFAVVATEVRKLAERSSEAARNINRLIVQSIDQVGEGTTLVNSSRESLDSILTSSESVAGVVGEISSASDEQLQGTEEVERAINQIGESSASNAALVEETTAASEQLRDQATGLEQQMRFFHLAQGEEAEDSQGSTDDSRVEDSTPEVRKPMPPSPASDEPEDSEWKNF